MFARIRSMVISASLLLLMIPTQGVGQKLDREKLGYLNYTQNPLSGVLLHADYYTLSFTTEDNDAFRRKVFEQQFDITPHLVAGEGQLAVFTIDIKEGTFVFDLPKKQNYQDKFTSGGQEKTRNNFYYKGNVSYHYTLKVMMDGNEIFRDDLRGSIKLQGEASESLTLANEYYIKKKTQVKQEMMPDIARQLAEMFKNQFGFIEKTTFINAIKIKEKKFEYPIFNKSFEDLERVYAVLKSSEPTAETESKLAAALLVYKEFLKDATPAEKKSRKDEKVTAAAYYNLGVAQFLSGQYAEAANSFKQAMSYYDDVMYDVAFYAKLCTNLSERLVLVEE